MDQSHNSKYAEKKTNTANFNLSGPVNLRDIPSIPFDTLVLSNKHATIARDANKSQQMIPDTNSTLAYTNGQLSKNKGGYDLDYLSNKLQESNNETKR